jgi:chaperonin cofactor prefoldin
MFGNKKDGFKYENEVKALIQEATNGLNQRILTLETQNQQLIQELHQLRNGICQEFQRLERRITDFTDVWHPMMTQNINRIKEDLEKTIAETEREDIKKVQEDLEKKMAIIAEYSSAGLMDNILVGYHRDSFPIFAHKNSSIQQIKDKLKGDRSDDACSTLILESLKHFKLAVYDVTSFQNVKIISKNTTIDISPTVGHSYSTEQFIQRIEVKNIYKLCQEYGIKFVINGQDRLNGVPIKMLFDE